MLEVGFTKSHIQKCSAYERHYSRSHSEKLYLHPDLTISQMYRKSFVENFNYSFRKPQNDTRGKCNKFQIKLTSTDEDKGKERIIKERDSDFDLTQCAYEFKKKKKRD
ncbi:hypothetical protein PR048_003363 [Dryococelus australis]|uniref:Uncharacterized protein n=1 Tax=Dryococelus australis TaxID=614101 RepID=A0ABQ9IMW1_9NEOP|nr:hypothetical protein PR048_003363 [Dryococelus australis]